MMLEVKDKVRAKKYSEKARTVWRGVPPSWKFGLDYSGTPKEGLEASLAELKTANKLYDYEIDKSNSVHKVFFEINGLKLPNDDLLATDGEDFDLALEIIRIIDSYF